MVSISKIIRSKFEFAPEKEKLSFEYESDTVELFYELGGILRSKFNAEQLSTSANVMGIISKWEVNDISVTTGIGEFSGLFLDCDNKELLDRIQKELEKQLIK